MSCLHRVSQHLGPPLCAKVLSSHSWDTAVCSPQLLIGGLRAPVFVDDSVTESESDNVEVVGVSLKAILTH